MAPILYNWSGFTPIPAALREFRGEVHVDTTNTPIVLVIEKIMKWCGEKEGSVHNHGHATLK